MSANTRKHLSEIWRAAVDATSPRTILPECISIESGRATLVTDQRLSYKNLYIVGAGKAAGAMACALEDVCSSDALRIARSAIIVPSLSEKPRYLRLLDGQTRGTNLPTESAMNATKKVRHLLADAQSDDLVVGLFSGGGSALLTAPIAGISLQQKLQTITALQKAGANIAELNCVRKHLSEVKGGRLVQTIPCPMINLIISDVIGDAIDVIASGAFAPDITTQQDALDTLEKYHLTDYLPQAVMDALNNSKNETPKAIPKNITNLIIANNEKALAAAATKAQTFGYMPIVRKASLSGDVADAAETFYREFESKIDQNHICYLAGGETTVKLGSNVGKGGRNQEFALHLLLKLNQHEKNHTRSAFLCAGSDGEDGPTDAAGAFVERLTLQAMQDLGLNPKKFLSDHNSYVFFDKTDSLFCPGPTETNVMDINIGLATSS